MRKQDELSRTDSCIAHAHPKEMVFVLLGRDTAAPFAIRAWADERVRLGKNVETDEQIVEARACADTMEKEGRQWVGAVSGASALCTKSVATRPKGSGMRRRRSEARDAHRSRRRCRYGPRRQEAERE